MSRQRSFLSLGMIVLMLALPWTAVADSSGRGGARLSENLKISTLKLVDMSQVEIVVEFENLTDYITYDYEITITRVDPNFEHQRYSGNFTTGADQNDYTVTKYWTPDQDGPYTVHSMLIQYGNLKATGSDTFGWGDVDSNSELPNAEITPTPELTHYDLFGNSSLADEVAIEMDAVGTEVGASYKIKWKLFQGEVVDNESALIGSTENTQHRNFVMSNFIDYLENNSNYTLASWLLRIETTEFEGTIEHEVGHESWSFTVGEAPPPTQGLLDLEFNCDFGDYDVWHMVLEEDNAGLATGTHLNCVIYNPNVVTVAGNVNVSATGVPPGAGIDTNMSSSYSIEAESSQAALLSFDCGGGNCAVTNGTATFEFNFVEGNHTFWDDATVIHTIEFEILENQTIITPEPIFGCRDPTALNFDSNATDDDGSCIHPPPLRVVLSANQTTGDAPLSVAFFANISGGSTPYEISWEFDDGAVAEDVIRVNHTFSTAGVYNVLLRATDGEWGWADMLERSVNIVVTEPPVIPDLSGYISHSGQLDPVNKDMVASFEFIGTANGGEGPYTFTWLFGDDTGENGSSILHEYARAGEYIVQLRIEDSAGRSLQLEETINIPKENIGNESGGISATQEGKDGDGTNFDIYATSTGAIGLLLMFGLFGRKRRESFLEAERRKLYGDEGSIWDDR